MKQVPAIVVPLHRLKAGSGSEKRPEADKVDSVPASETPLFDEFSQAYPTPDDADEQGSGGLFDPGGRTTALTAMGKSERKP